MRCTQTSGGGNRCVFRADHTCDHKFSSIKNTDKAVNEMVWNYKILLVITNGQGVSTQLLHYQDQEHADEAFKQLAVAPQNESFKTSVLKLYKPVKSTVGYREED
jgi:hypothetical protein